MVVKGLEYEGFHDVIEDTDRDRHEWNLNEVDPGDKDVWR